MNTVSVRIPTPLRPHTGGATSVQARGDTVGATLLGLKSAHPGLVSRVLTPEGELRPYVNIFVGDRNVRDLKGLDTPVNEGDVVFILPAVAGGAGRARDARLEVLRREIRQVTPQEALELQRQGAALVDVRDDDEITAGSPAGAHRLGRSYLELRIEDAVPELDRSVVTLCSSGVRSLFAAAALAEMGYTRVASLEGGFNRWKDEGLPFEVPQVLEAADRARYSRQLSLPEVGETGQRRLLESRVLIVGAGGLGSPAALYLAAAGVGTLGIVDHDVVDRSNLQRQPLHTDDRVGRPKVESAVETLKALNPGVAVEGHNERLTGDNVERLLGGYDVIVDGSDNFAARYLINDACVHLGLPNVHGAVYRFEGQATVFWPARGGPCYRCLFPEPPPAELAPSCVEAGVLGVLPGVIGMIQAVECIKLLLGIGETLMGRLLYYDALQGTFRELKLPRDPECPRCGAKARFTGYVDYDRACPTDTG